MKSLSVLGIMLMVLQMQVWTPEPTPAPVVDELGTTTVVGHSAIFLMDAEQMQTRSGSDVRYEDVFPPETHVEDWQFYMEKSLYARELPKGTKSIGRFGFARSGLEEIILPQGVESIGYAAFYHCDELEEVMIPSSVKSIAPKAFSYTPWMEAFMKGESYPGTDFLIVGDGVLIAYRGKAETVVIPEGVKTIAAESFLNHGEIKEVICPDTVINIEDKNIMELLAKPTA